MSMACLSDLKCCRQNGHNGRHLYPDQSSVEAHEHVAERAARDGGLRQEHDVPDHAFGFDARCSWCQGAAAREGGLREAVIHAARDVDGLWDGAPDELISWHQESAEALEDLRDALVALDAALARDPEGDGCRHCPQQGHTTEWHEAHYTIAYPEEEVH